MALVDRKTFLDWVRLHHQALYRHAYWMTGQTELAADLVQETFYRAWKGREKLRQPANPLPWLLTILRRAAYQEFNHGLRQAEHLPDVQWLQGLDASSDNDELIDLARALKKVSPLHRDLLLLYALHGLSYAEIGEQLEVPIGTVMSRLARARSALRQALDQEAARDDTVVPFAKSKRS